MRKHLVFLLAALVTVATGSGCIFSPDKGKVTPPPPPPGPVNDTPENTIGRFIWAYENKKAQEYENLFTNDFTFEFSTAVDPTLATKYASGWFKEDEKTSARHLFEGFSADGVYYPAASSIDLTLANKVPVDDQEGRDPTKYKVLATRVDALIVVPPSQGQTEDTRYLVDNNYHRFFLVRGDAAILDPGQVADSTRWYLYRWIDETAQPAITAGGLATAASSAERALPPVTWGQVKAARR